MIGRSTLVLVFRESFKNLSRKGIKPKLTIISKSVFKQSITLIPYQHNECVDLISRVRIRFRVFVMCCDIVQVTNHNN